MVRDVSGTHRIGSILKRLREARGLTSRGLADLAHVTQSAVSHYETGRMVPRPRKLREIARALHVAPEPLLWFAYMEHEASELMPKKLFRDFERFMRSQLGPYENASMARKRRE